MLTEEQIKFMKENRVPWSLLTDEEKCLFERVNKIKDTLYYGYDREWDIPHDKTYSPNVVYRLRPDYEQEPEPINYDESIKNINTRLGALEAREGKMSKTDVKYIMDNIANVRKRVEALENAYNLHSVEERLTKLEVKK